MSKPTVKRAISILSIIAFIVSCGATSQTPQTVATKTSPAAIGEHVKFYYRLPKTGNAWTGTRENHIIFDAKTSFNAGPHAGNPATVDLDIVTARQYPTNIQQIVPQDITLAVAVVSDGKERQIPVAQVERLGIQAASQSICQGRRVGPNIYARGLHDPAQISEFLAATGGRVLGQRLPEGMTLSQSPSVRATPSGWTVMLWCY